MNKKLFKMLVAVTAMVGVLSTGIVAFAEEPAGNEAESGDYSVQSGENYTVQNGDYLKKIASKLYGDASFWETIYNANKDIIKNPNLIYGGQVLCIPSLTDNGTTADEAAVTPPTEETAADTPADEAAVTPSTEETVADTPADETAVAPSAEETVPDAGLTAAPARNCPVGTNPVYLEGENAYRYSRASGVYYIDVFASGNGYYSEMTDAYGITYCNYCGDEGVKVNEAAMGFIANYVAEHADSETASAIVQHGTQIVVISADSIRNSIGMAGGGEYNEYRSSEYDKVDGRIYIFASTNGGLEDAFNKDILRWNIENLLYGF